MTRRLLVTIDTEVDKDRHWRVSSPATFRSLTHGVPAILGPLFGEFGVRPTYLLSAEVMEDAGSVSVLRAVQASGEAELGTHLHAEFVAPERTHYPGTMAGAAADALQRQYPRAIEQQKLRSLTDLFQTVFTVHPRAFRAGRYGMSEHTLELLAQLDYRVDSSVTPGMRWQYREGTVDYREWSGAARRIQTASGTLVELPIGVIPGSRLAPIVRDAPAPVRRAALKLLPWHARYRWLRPSFSSGAEMIRYIGQSPEPILTMMFHSMEVIPGASPYAADDSDVGRIVAGMREVFSYCRKAGIGFATMSEAAATVDA